MVEQHTVLVIEDEADIADFVSLELQHEGYQVCTASDGREGLTMALEKEWDVILLDIMLPGLSGMEVCRRIRAASKVPIIMLTARGSIPDRVAGLDAGADDYVIKPFAIEELLARIRALLRRNANDEEILSALDLTMNTATREVCRGGQEISLTAREFELLEMFLRNQNHVLSREVILERIWGHDFPGVTNVVDVYVRYLRQKIDVPFDTPLIHTVRGVGYMLKGVTRG